MTLNKPQNMMFLRQVLHVRSVFLLHHLCSMRDRDRSQWEQLRSFTVVWSLCANGPETSESMRILFHLNNQWNQDQLRARPRCRLNQRLRVKRLCTRGSQTTNLGFTRGRYCALSHHQSSLISQISTGISSVIQGHSRPFEDGEWPLVINLGHG